MLPPTLSFILRRLLHGIPVVLIVAVGVFVILEAAPGDAVDAYLAQLGGGDASLAADLREQWGLDRSELGRFIAYLTSIVTLDLGRSVAVGGSVVEAILTRLPATLLLMGASIAFSASLGVLLGGIAALRRGGMTDGVLTLGALILNAIPGFWLGLILIVVFVVWLGWFPHAGFGSINGPRDPIGRSLDIAWHLVLPVTTLGLTYMALYLRLMRGAMIETRASTWVRAARARGLPETRIVRRHMARPALLPVVTMLGLQAGTMLGGSVVIETVFAIPGLGSLAYLAVSQRDLPLIAGVVLAGTVLVIIVNILVDLSYARIDPRMTDERLRTGVG
ncbi:MAG: ABC transporter permease [Chloroflexi bacterium]|nr:ABC transporter permease [Chloroflexota bacterium]